MRLSAPTARRLRLPSGVEWLGIAGTIVLLWIFCPSMFGPGDFRAAVQFNTKGQLQEFSSTLVSTARREMTSAAAVRRALGELDSVDNRSHPDRSERIMRQLQLRTVRLVNGKPSLRLSYRGGFDLSDVLVEQLARQFVVDTLPSLIAETRQECLTLRSGIDEYQRLRNSALQSAGARSKHAAEMHKLARQSRWAVKTYRRPLIGASKIKQLEADQKHAVYQLSSSLQEQNCLLDQIARQRVELETLEERLVNRERLLDELQSIDCRIQRVQAPMSAKLLAGSSMVVCWWALIMAMNRSTLAGARDDSSPQSIASTAAELGIPAAMQE